jgi:CheY-like chemotaxis protein
VSSAQDSYVLIVEDDAALRSSLRDTLADEGLLVRVAANGLEALEVLARFGPAAVVLMDLMMPVMDGETFRRRQLQDPALAHIPVVVMTASNLRGARHLGAVALLRKPFQIDDLFEKLQPFMARKAS